MHDDKGEGRGNPPPLLFIFCVAVKQSQICITFMCSRPPAITLVYKTESEKVMCDDENESIVPVIKFKLAPGARLPEYKTAKAACFDIESLEGATIQPGEVHMFSTGLYPAIADGYELAIRPRSSSCKTRGLIPNSPGTIDSDYPGEIKIGVLNATTGPLIVRPGDRIAQARLQRAPQNPIVQISDEEHAKHHADTDRKGGFGSTGGVATNG